MTEESFWGDLENVQIEPTPLIHLKEQASQLGKKTGGIIRGKVTRKTTPYQGLTYCLNIVAPFLNNYEVSILEVRYRLDAYPLKLEDMAKGKVYECSCEEEFLKDLKEILSSDQVRRIIISLLSNSADWRK